MPKSVSRPLFLGALCTGLLLSLLSVLLINTSSALAVGREKALSPLAASVLSPDIFPGDTGQFARGKPTTSYCNGRLYVAWAGPDDRLRIGWGSTGNAFSNVVTFAYDAYANVNANPSIYSGPALACWRPSGVPGYRLYMAWTDQNANLQMGYFDGNASHNYLFNETPIKAGSSTQTSHYSPALEVDPSTGGYLRVAWTGTDANQELNILRTSNGTTWNPKNTWTTQKSAGGPGFTYFCPSSGFCGPYLAWIGTDALSSVNIGDFNTSSGAFTKLATLGGYTTFFSQPSYDVSLVAQGAVLYVTNVSLLGDLVVGWSSTPSNSSSWTGHDTLLPALYGAAGTVASGGHLWVAWTDQSGLLVDLGQYN